VGLRWRVLASADFAEELRTERVALILHACGGDGYDAAIQFPRASASGVLTVLLSCPMTPRKRRS
jgi:hypothetical protein